MALVGYARVSLALDQTTGPQRQRLLEAGCTRVFADEGVSGTLARRPQLDACLDYLRDGEDTLTVVRLDRIGRSVRHLLDLAALLQERGIGLRVLDQPIDTTTPVGRMTFVVLGAVAEFERDLIRERTLDGLAAARVQGRRGGRRPVLSPAKIAHARRLVDEGQMTMAQIAELLGCSRSTLYRTLELDATQR